MSFVRTEPLEFEVLGYILRFNLADESLRLIQCSYMKITFLLSNLFRPLGWKNNTESMYFINNFVPCDCGIV